MVQIKALMDYKDKELDKEVVKDEVYEVTEERANVIIRKGYAKLIAIEDKKVDENELQGKGVANKKKANTNKR